MNEVIPFRWNIKKAPELGQLLNATFKGDSRYDDSHFYDALYYADLRDCTAKIIAYSEGADLCFVGRSLDDVYDYLAGLYEHTSQQDRHCCLNISLYGRSLKTIEKDCLQSIAALKAHCTALGLDPQSIMSNKRATCFVDVVSEGGTYEEIYHFLVRWTEELKLCVKTLQQKLRFLGITSRKKNSPNTWRWQQHSDWTKHLKARQVKNISVSWEFWSFIANNQAKMTPSNQPKRWFGNDLHKPKHDPEHISALQHAYHLFHVATQAHERQAFLKVLNANQIAIQQSWIRALALEMKG